MTKVVKEVPANPDFQLRVEIDDDVFQKIMHWINKSNNEVSGLGKVVYDTERKVLRVIEAILLDQENTAATTEIDAGAISKAMYELRDTEGTLNWWWHSHVKMDVFWSQTDHNAIKTLGQHGWFLSTVFNQREEMRSAYYQSGPIQVFADHLDTDVVRAFDEELINAWDKEYAEKVKTKVYPRVGMGAGGLGLGFSGSRGWDSGNRWGGNFGRSVDPKVPAYLRDDEDDDDGIGDYVSPSQRGRRGKSSLLVDGFEEDSRYEEDFSEAEAADDEDDMKEELAAWDLELDDLEESGAFPSQQQVIPQPAPKKKKKKGA